MQRHELEPWLGDTDLTAEQVTELLATANDIEARYPNDDDDTEERGGALEAAHYLLLNGSAIVVDTLARRLTNARTAEVQALAGLQQAALTLIRENGRDVASEQGFAKAAGVDRMTVRKWLGKR